MITSLWWTFGTLVLWCRQLMCKAGLHYGWIYDDRCSRCHEEVDQ